MSSCSRHASKEAVGACINCGKLVCVACHKEIDGKSYCPVCLEKLFAATEVKTEPTSVSGPAVARPAPLPAEKDKSGAESELEKTRIVQPGVTQSVSDLWWLLPVFLAWVGGLAAWLVIKDKAPQKALNMLFSGIGMSVIQGVLAVILVFALCVPAAIKPEQNPPVSTTDQTSSTTSTTEDQTATLTTDQKESVPSAENWQARGTILTEALVHLTSNSIGPGGGTVTVDKPGDPLNGLQLSVPAGAYQDARMFKLSSAPITMNTFGPMVNPVSPMIVVDNGGESSEKPMLVRVPVSIPPGYEAMGYFYDDKTGTLEPAFPVGRDTNSVTLATSHFSSCFISTMLSSLFEASRTRRIDSGFRPGTDGFEFANNGSYLTFGNCQGQSIGAMWFYFARPEGSDTSLYGLYDNNGVPNIATPGFPWDDSLAIRFCTKLQMEESPVFKTYRKWGYSKEVLDFYGFPQSENLTGGPIAESWREFGGDSLTRRLFELSILTTHEPQLVVINQSPGKQGEYGDIGHAMVVYSIENGTLHVYNPNSVGHTLDILWEDGHYKEFQAGLNAEANEDWYDLVTWVPKSTVIKWDKIQSDWDQVKNGTIGDDIFPAYRVFIIDEKKNRTELSDGYELASKKFKVELDNPDIKARIFIVTHSWEEVEDKFADGDGWYELNDNEKGEIWLGVEGCGDRIFSGFEKFKVQKNRYVNFKWYKVTYGEGKPDVDIVAPPQPGLLGEQYTFTARTRNMTKSDKLKWSIKDKNKKVVVEFSDTESIDHTFTSPGDWTITLEVARDNKILTGVDKSITFKVVVPFIKIIADPEIGASGQTCGFKAETPKGFPSDAKYTWQFGDGKGGEGQDCIHIYDNAGKYDVKVTVRWIDETITLSLAQLQTQGTLKYTVEGDLPLTIVADPAIGSTGKKTTFHVKGDKIPDGTAFFWEFGDADNTGNYSSVEKDGSAGHTYEKERAYPVKVAMLDKKNPTPIARAAMQYKVQSAHQLGISAPTEVAAGKGLVNTDYTFLADWAGGKAPDGVQYTWWADGAQQPSDSGSCSKSFASEGTHTVKCRALWAINGNKVPGVNASISFNLTRVAGEPKLTIVLPPDIEAGKGLVKTRYFFTLVSENIPDTSKFSWFVDGNPGGQGDKGWFSFSQTKRYTVSLKAAWTDSRGNAQQSETSRDFDIGALIPSISIIPPGTKGVVGIPYTFEAKPGNLPPGSVIEWYFEGGQNESGKKYRDMDTVTHIFKSAGDKTVRVQVVVGNNISAVVSDQMVFVVESQALPTISIIPPGTKGVAGNSCSFKAKPDNLPPGSVIEWYFEGGPNESGKKYTNVDTVTHIFKSTGDKTIRVQVIVGNDTSALASDQIIFAVESPALPASVSIIPPPAIDARKGVTGTRYVFVADVANVPKGALYSWYINGKGVTQGIDDPQAIAEPSFFKAGFYTMVVVVTWRDLVTGDQRVTNTLSFNIADATPVQPPVNPTLSITPSSTPDGMIVNTEYTFTAAMTNATATGAYSWDIGYVNATSPLGAASLKCKFPKGGTYTIRLKATGKTPQGNKDLAAELEVTVYENTEIAKEEVSFAVYRWLTMQWADGSTTKTRQYCGQYHIQILRDNIIIDSGDSVARNGAFEVVLPTGHYTYRVSGKYLTPAGDCSGASGFDVVKGGRNFVEIEDSPLTMRR